MEYLLKASAVIILFYLCFNLFLKKETFFEHNRWFLLIGLIVALVFPFIVIPIYIPIEPISISETANALYENVNNITTTTQTNTTFEWLNLILVIYSIGLCALFIQFILQFGSLILLLIRNPKNKDGIYTYVIVENKISPFSFFKWIVYNPENYTTDELQLILIHEKVHAKQMHSLDILFTQLACVIFWFNPLIWLYRKEVRQNLEHIADFKTQTISKDEKEYQRLLLKTSVSNHKISLSNNFYNSLIKERIVMLKKSRSNKKKQIRYLFIIPLLAGLLMSMNTEKIYVEDSALTSNESTSKIFEEISQKATLKPDNLNKEEKDFKKKSLNYKKPEINKKTKPSKSTNKVSPNKSEVIVMATPKKDKKESPLVGDTSITVINKNTTDSELDDIKTQFKKEGLTAKFKGVKRNKKGEITAIKIEIKSKKSNASYNVNSDEAIDTIKIVYNANKNSISIGNGHSNHEKNTFVYETKGSKHKVHKSGNGSHVYVISEDEHDEEHEHYDDVKYIIKGNSKEGKVKRIKRTKNIEVISGDDNEVIEILIDEDDSNEHEIKKIIVNGKAKNVWVSDDGEEDIIILKSNHDNKNIFITSDTDKNPLFILDGKEVTKEKFEELKPDSIESINVLKGESAIEKYGDKGKDGVIIVKTKKKN